MVSNSRYSLYLTSCGGNAGRPLVTCPEDLFFVHSQIRMSQLEVKEKELNKLKQESDQLVLNQHPASDKIVVGGMRFTFSLG